MPETGKLVLNLKEIGGIERRDCGSNPRECGCSGKVWLGKLIYCKLVNYTGSKNPEDLVSVEAVNGDELALAVVTVFCGVRQQKARS